MSSTHPRTPSQNRIASGSAHALNNAVGMLWAVREWLEEDQKVDLERARRVLDDATAGVQAVSDALAVLALTDADVDSVRDKRRSFTLQAHDMVRISQALGYTARAVLADWSEDVLAPPSLLDGDTLKAIVVCMAVTLRQEAGTRQSLGATISKIPGKDGQTMCAIEISTATAAPAKADSACWTDHPCAMAIQHARKVLARIGVVIEHQPAHSVRLVWPEATSS